MKRALIYILTLMVSAGVIASCARVSGRKITEADKCKDTFFLKDLNLYLLVDGSKNMRRVFFSKNDSVFSDYIGFRCNDCSRIQYYFPGGDTIVITDPHNEIQELEARNFKINHVKGTIGPVLTLSNGVTIEGTVLSDSSIFSKRAHRLNAVSESTNEISLWDPNDSLTYNSLDSVHSHHYTIDDVAVRFLRILLGKADS